MSANPTGRSPDVQRLVDEGYTVVIDGQYLVLENVPYVTGAQQIDRGALISSYQEIDGVARVNNDHTVWFTGSVPHTADGKSLESAMVADTNVTEVAGRKALCRFSYKSERPETIANFYNKMTHYARKLQGYASILDPNVSATSRQGSISVRQARSVFLFPNPAISREGLDAYEAKLKVRRVSIVGLGGTGSYILDAIAKTPIEEIHLYDDDIIDLGSMYRMPGAVDAHDAQSERKKTDFLKEIYSRMRVGIQSHPTRIHAENVAELNGSQFVFLAIDDGPSREVIARHLAVQGIPFIDVGLGVDKIAEDLKLIARVRSTFIDAADTGRIDRLPTAADGADAVYSNIQVVELNAINAMLAVVMYKQALGFYATEIPVQDLRYRVSFQRLSTDSNVKQ